jgi:N-acetylneuraminic acid mutarotase
MEEYRSLAFGGQLHGDILVQHWNGEVHRVKLTADGRSVDSLTTVIGGPTGLDIVEGPAGALLGANYTGNSVTVSIPAELPSALMTATDITPWRAPAAGGAGFIIGGENFGTLVDTHVHIGGEEAVVTSVSPRRIRGVIPASSTPTAALVDVEVESGGEISVIPGAFRYLLADGEGTGVWHSDAPMPVALGEVASGVINGVMYLVGDQSPETLSYDIASNTWRSDLAARPFVGDHHAAEVIGGKLYLFGGLGDGSDGQVQIYDPGTDSWSLGASMPYAGGSCSTGMIDGLVYIAGGIVANSTVTDAAVYNPQTDTWNIIAPMPLGRNHAAGASDGARLWIFGGRGPGSGDYNTIAEGFDDVQVYDPATDTWEWSGDAASTLTVLPQRRGGMGTAAYFRGELYVIGGETTPGDHGQVAGDVYNRVDVYNPLTNTWRLETVIPTARHGIYPLVYDGKIYVAGGGIRSGYSGSKVLEVFER